MSASSARAYPARQKAVSLDGLTCGALLSAAAGHRQNDVMVRANFENQTSSQVLTFGDVARQSGRLARLIASISHGEPATAILAMALGRHAILMILACLRAGVTPILVRPDLDVDQMTAQAESLGASIAIGIDIVAEYSPLVVLRDMAARSFGIRCVAGFGALVPDGVIPLEGFIVSDGDLMPLPLPNAMGHIGFADDPSVRVSETDLLDAALGIARALGIGPSSKIVTTMTGGGLVSLASGLGTALLTGAEFSPLGIFHLKNLWASFADGRAVYLVAPAGIEPALLQSGLTSHKSLMGVLFVHAIGQQPESELPRPVDSKCRVVDAYQATAGTLELRTRG